MDFELPILAPSILAADFSRLGKEIEQCNKADIRWLHCDVMDGHFVPNISYGPGIVEAANRSTDAFLDVHLMIENPDKYIQAFVTAGANHITVHQETCPHLHRTVQNIHSQNITAGVAVNPGTSLEAIKPILGEIEMVLLMSVNPGFGGQSFIPSTYQRLQQLVQMREQTGTDFVIEVDGGVKPHNIQKIAQAGAEVLVAGSAVFKADDMQESISTLKKRAQIGKETIV
ncbi:ribulose-phosphate 3-epimerase [Fodinibius saliphilus]|uniref:ribulose-phosphate 3-epimerase n=1 Tax=Fodinibius saliphilus TaxID=1920650 RepID=UPI001108D4B9|nr:ribulose-phosphate 3-epimerase [Fodinibius saliphilus]